MAGGWGGARPNSGPKPPGWEPPPGRVDYEIERAEHERVKREQRELSEKILKSKGLASSDEEDNEDSAAAWLEKVKQKQEAMKKAKLLEEMDEQFGVDELIETAKRPKANTSQNYDSKNLKGIYF